MGLFGSILQAGGGIIGTVLGGMKNKKAVKKAGKAQQLGMANAIAEIQRQFDVARGDYKPWMDAGAAAIGGMGDLTGLNGVDTQQASLDGLRDSPLFKSMFDSGREALLQSGSATGGVRGGNMVRGLADFGADTFAQVIQQQLANLGGISSGGANMTSNLGGLGAAKSGAIGSLLTGQGESRARSILGVQGVRNNTMSQMQQIMASIIPGMGGMGGIGGGGMSGGGMPGFGGGMFNAGGGRI